MSQLYAGLDVHSKRTFWAIQDAQGGLLAETECRTTREDLLNTVRQHQLGAGTQVGLEAGSQARWICHLLAEEGLEANVLSAQEVRAKVLRRGQKSDRRDALEICDGLRRNQFVARVWVPPAPILRLREILSRRRHFVAIRTAQVNAVKGLLKTRSEGCVSWTLTSDAAWTRLRHKYEASELAGYLALHHAMWSLARHHVADLERQLAQAVKPLFAEFRLLQTAPGVGPITAATFIAVVGDPRRFGDASRLASYVGLIPSVSDSGQRQRHGSITKQGSPALRTALCEAAHQARRPNNPLNPYFRKIKARSGYKTAAVAVAHRLLRILYQMWRNNQAFDVQQLNVRFEPATMSWTCYYQIGRAAMDGE